MHPVIGDAARIVRPLILRLPPRQPACARVPCGDPHIAAYVGLVDKVIHRPTLDGVVTLQPCAARSLLQLSGRPDIDLYPMAVVQDKIGLGCRWSPHKDLPTSGDSPWPAAQVLVKEPHQFQIAVDVRPRPRHRRVLVHPRAGDQTPTRHVLDGAERVVAVAVGPAADQEHGTRHASVAVAARPKAHRTTAPRLVGGRVPQPLQQPRLVLLQPASPFRLPIARTHFRPHSRCRRQCVHRDHVQRVIDEVERAQHAAHVMHVVGVAVVGGVHGGDCTELRNALHRHVERVEARIGGAHHSHLAGAPLLGGDPFDHDSQVAPLDVGVLVLGNARGIARAA